MAGRCEREGSSSETSLVFGLKETAVFVKGWKATWAAPSSPMPVLAGPVSSEKSDIELTIWLFGSMKVIWLKVALGSASTAFRVMGLKAMPISEGERVYVRNGTPEVAVQLRGVEGVGGSGHVEVSSLPTWKY